MGEFLSRPISRNARLRELWAPPLLEPGGTAQLTEQIGFDAAYLGGFATTGAQIGRPDVGLLSGTEMIDTARRVASAVDVPVIADADTGYGNAVNVVCTMTNRLGVDDPPGGTGPDRTEALRAPRRPGRRPISEPAGSGSPSLSVPRPTS